MADKTDLPDDDELDIDGLDDIDFDSPEFGGEDNRDPVTRFKAAAVDSALDPDTYVGVTRAIAKNALPREYSEAYNSVEDTLKFITDTGRETADKVKKPINDLRDFVTDAIEEMDDSGNETIEKIKKTVLGITSREREGSDEHAKQRDYDGEAIAATLGSIFDGQKAQLEGMRSKDKQDRLSTKLNKARDQASLEFSGLTNQLLARMVGYQDSILFEYQRKDLELQHRQYYALRDILSAIKGGLVTQTEANAAIVKNTGLPDWKKSTIGEDYKSEAFNKIYGNVNETVGQYNEKFFGKFKDNIKAKIDGGIEDFTAGMTQGLDAAQQIKDLTGDMDPFAMAGSMGTPIVLESLAGRLGKKFASKIAKYPSIANIADDLGYFLANSPAEVTDFMKNWDGKPFPGWLIEKYPFLDKVNARMIADQLQELMPGLANQQLTMANTLHQTAMEEVGWDVMSRKSLVEIIPGFLSRILEQATIANGGSGRVVYSAQQEAFVDLDTAIESTKSAMFTDIQTRRNRALDDAVSSVKGGELSDAVKTKLGKIMLARALRNEPFRAERIVEDTAWTDEEREQVTAFFTLGEENPRLLRRMFTDAMKEMARGQDDMQKFINTTYATGGADVLIASGLVKEDKSGQREMLSRENKDKFLSKLYENRKKVRNKVSIGSLDELFALVEGVDPAVAEKIKEFIRQDKKVLKEVVKLADEEDPRKIIAKFNELEDRLTKSTKKFVFDNDMVSDIMFGQGNDSTTYGNSRVPDEIVTPRMFTDVANMANNAKTFTKDKFKRFTDGAQAKADSIRTSPWVMQLMRAMRDKDIETLKKLITDEQNITFLKSKFKESRVNSLIKRAESFIKSHEAQYNNVKDTVSAKTEEFAAFAEDKIGKNRIRRIKAGGRLAKRKGRRLRGAAEEKLEEIKTSQGLADAKEAVEDRDIDKLKSLVTDNEAITALRETMDNTSVNDVVDRLKTTVKEQTEQAKEAAKEKYESSGAKAKVDGVVADVQEKYEVSGAKARVDELTDTTANTYKSAKEQLEEFIENGKKTFDREHFAQIDNFNQNLIKKQTEAARLWREELAKKASETAERVKPKRYRADRKEPTIEDQQEEQLEEQDTSAVNEVNRLVEYTLRQDFIELEGKAGLPVHVLSLPGLNKSDDPTSSSNTEMIDFLRGSFSEVSQILAMVAYNTDQIAKGTGDGKSKGSLFMRLMGKVERGGKSAVGIIPKILTSYFSGVTKMAHAGLGIGGSIIKGGISAAGSVGSFLLMRDKIRDIYVKGKEAPVLFADRLKMGQYFDVATGKKIKRIKDIKGPVRDMDGNIVLTQEDIAAGLYNPYSKLDLSIGGMIGGVSKLFGKAMSLNFKVMKKLVTVPAKFLIGSEYLLKSAGDVYVKGEEHPRLTKFIMMRGGYFDAGSGDPIKVLGDIKGEVKDNQGNVLLSNDDIRKGLVDKNGRAINSSRLANIIRGAFRVGGKIVGGVAKGAMKLAGAGLKAGATIAKAAGGLASNLMPWNWSKWGTKSNDMMASEEAVSTLKSILQLLDERLQKPKRKIFGDTDGDGDRDGSLADLTGKRGKNKRPAKVKVPEDGEKKESAWSKILGVLGPLGMILGAGFSAVTSAVGAMGSLVVGAIGTIASGIAAVLGPIITSGLGAVAGLLGKVIKAISAARAASAASDVVDDLADGVDGPDGDKKNKKGRGKGKGPGRAAGKARGFFGRMVDGAMDLGGKAKDLVVEKGGKAAKAVKGQAGKATQLVSGQVSKQVTRVVAQQAAKKATVAAAGAGAAAVAGSGALGAAAVAAAPLVATGVAVAGAAYTGYEIGNWAWKKWADVEELERLRFLQYGINPDDQDQVQMIRSLEEEFVDEVSWRSNTSPDFKLSPSEALEMWAENMGVDIQIPAHAEEWVTWFSKRFYPIVMNHLITCKNLGDINLNDVDDEIDEKRIPSYLSSVTVKYRYREKGDPFAVVASPFPGYYLQTNELAIAMYTDSLFAKYGIANPVSLASLVPKDAKETDGKAESDKVEEYEAGKALPKNAETSVTRQVDKAKLDTIDPQLSQLETGQLAAKEEPRFNKPEPTSAPTQIAPAPVEPPKVKLPDTNTPVANPAGSGMVKYMRPCKGPITSPYGMRVHPIKKVQKMHKGIDIGAPGGTPVYASAAGSIFRADYSSSYGNVVYIRHANGWSTRYAHMQKFGPGIAAGVSVQQGQLIGYVGNTGASAGNHLHFEMRTGSNYDSPTVDPAQYIGAASEIKAINASVKLEDQATLDGTLEGHNTFTGMPESTQPTDKVINVGGRTIVIRDEVAEGSTDPVGNMDSVNRGSVDPSMDAPVNQTYDNVKSINNSSAPNVPSAGGDSGYVPTYTGVPGFDKTPGSSSSSSDREFGSYEPVSTTRMGTPESNAGINTQMQQMEQAAEDESIKHLRSMASGIARLVTIAESLGTSLGKAPAAPRETARGVNTNTAAEPKPASKAGPSNGGMGKGSTVIKPPVDVRSR